MTATERLALGTVQFGQTYGVAGGDGRVTLSEAARIVDVAGEAGIDTLDTATGYGDSEARLGEIGVAGWRIISKLPELPAPIDDVASWVEASVTGSLERLGVDHLHGLLMHRPLELAGDRGAALLAGIVAVRDQGLVHKIGISVYGPDELDAVWVPDFDMVQGPCNVLDRRLIASGWLGSLTESGVEVHARSVFLQGLLLMRERPGYFDRWSGSLAEWMSWCESESLSPLQASLGFVLAQPEIDRVVVGVDSAEHLEEILAVADIQVAPAPDTLASHDLDLINPSRWKLS